MANEINHEDARNDFNESKKNRERRDEAPFVRASGLEKTFKAGVYTLATAAIAATVLGLGSLLSETRHRIFDKPKIEDAQSRDNVKAGYIALSNMYDDFEGKRYSFDEKYRNLKTFTKTFSNKESLERSRRFEVGLRYARNHFLGIENRLEELKTSFGQDFDQGALCDYLWNIHDFINSKESVVEDRKDFVEVIIGGEFRDDPIFQERKDVDKNEEYLTRVKKIAPGTAINSVRGDTNGDLIISWLKAYGEVLKFDSDYRFLNNKWEKVDRKEYDEYDNESLRHIDSWIRYYEGLSERC